MFGFVFGFMESLEVDIVFYIMYTSSTNNIIDTIINTLIQVDPTFHHKYLYSISTWS